MASLPVLDLRDFSERRASDAFCRALARSLEEFGFVAIEQHGVAADSICEVYSQFERFFALPDERKALCAGVAGGARGFTPFGREHAKDSALADLKEFFHVGRDFEAHHSRASEYPPNLWPEELPELRASALAVYAALDACAATLLEALAIPYGLEPRTFAAMLVEGNSILRALHYPPVDDASPDGALRAASHEDINLITLLCEATDSGLEIRTSSGDWLPVEAVPGQIVVNAGDMLAWVTGAAIPATTHRVVQPPGAAQRDRYSLPFFAHPPPESELRVLAPFATAERCAAYPPTTADAYLQERLRAIGLA